MTLTLDTLLDAQDRVLKQNRFLVAGLVDRQKIIAELVRQGVSFYKMRHMPNDTLHITTANGLDIYFSEWNDEDEVFVVPRVVLPNSA